MATKVEKKVVVDVPLSIVYNQWTQFEEFPRFMGAVEKVTQLSDDRLEWVAEIGGVRRQWIAKVLEQVPDRKVAWAAVEGFTNAGMVTFAEAGQGGTEVRLTLEYEPEGVLEKAADALKVIDRQAEDDLENFANFMQEQRRASGGWRGTINEGATVGTPGVEDAASSYGDSGKVGDPAAGEAGFRDPASGDTGPGLDIDLGGTGLADEDLGADPALRRNPLT